MFFEVPQYIDIEDKIAFQLTAKQLGWFALGGLFIFLAWGTLEKGAFILASIIIVLISSVMAFVRPYGLSMASFLSHGILYFFKPKIYVWQKTPDQSKGGEDFWEETAAKKIKSKGKNKKKLDKMDDLAGLLDNIQKF